MAARRAESGPSSLDLDLDLETFLDPAFDARVYANSLVADEARQRQGRGKGGAHGNGRGGGADELAIVTPDLSSEDISAALAKLTYRLDNLKRRIETTVSENHLLLVDTVWDPKRKSKEAQLDETQAALQNLTAALARLKDKVSRPSERLREIVHRQDRVEQVGRALSRVNRFLVIYNRLDAQMRDILGEGSASPTTAEADRNLYRASSTLTELSNFLVEEESSMTLSKAPAPISLHSITVLRPMIDDLSRWRICLEERGLDLVRDGIKTTDHSLIGQGMQILLNLAILNDHVSSLVNERHTASVRIIREKWDVSALAAAVQASMPTSTSAPGSGTSTPASNFLASAAAYRSRNAQRPAPTTAANLVTWTVTLWKGLEELFLEAIPTTAQQLWSLHQVLQIKWQPVQARSFAALVARERQVEVLDFIGDYWRQIADSLSNVIREAAESKTFIHSTLSEEFPRLQQLVYQCLDRCSAYTESVEMVGSPEETTVIASLQVLRSAFLDKVTSRLANAVDGAFLPAGNSKSFFPGRTESVNLALVGVGELDSVRFDRALYSAVLARFFGAVQVFFQRARQNVIEESAETTISGRIGSFSLSLNLRIALGLQAICARLATVVAELPDEHQDEGRELVTALQSGYEGLVVPLLQSTARDLKTQVARIEEETFEDEPMQENRRKRYMDSIEERLTWLRREVSVPLKPFDDSLQTWLKDIIIRPLLRQFLFRASLVQPLSESINLRLTSDLAQLEFSINQLLSSTKSTKISLATELGNDYAALREFRSLLFMSMAELSRTDQYHTLLPAIVVHNIMIRLALKPLPHQIKSMTLFDYTEWALEPQRSSNDWQDIVDAIKTTHLGTDVVTDKLQPPESTALAIALDQLLLPPA